MDEELMSKKDLLELTGISYGQLYRWKRKGLLPDDWFIRKSTFTGQETFFPKLKVLSRIEKILGRKEDVSLDDLADTFSPDFGSISFGKDEIASRGIALPDIVNIYTERYAVQAFGINDVLCVHLLSRYMTSGDLSLSEGQTMAEVLKEGLIKFYGKPCEIILARKLGVFCCFMTSPPCEISADSGMRIIAKVNIQTTVDELKPKIY